VDYAIMEPAAKDKDRQFAVCTVLMDLKWLDVGNWPSYGQTLEADKQGNRVALAQGAASSSGGKTVLVNSTGNLIVNPHQGHTVALLGCKDLIVVHTPDATLVMPREHAEHLKDLHGQVDPGLR
jgi:mannose-1-phosphate guanylyltransferase